jgi:hypothetical protein
VIKHLHIDQRVGGGEARSVWHHYLDFILPAGLLVDRPTVRRGEHELIGRAKLLAARVQKFLHFGAGRGGVSDQSGGKKGDGLGMSEENNFSPPPLRGRVREGGI